MDNALDACEEAEIAPVISIAESYVWFNPHLTLRGTWHGDPRNLRARAGGWPFPDQSAFHHRSATNHKFCGCVTPMPFNARTRVHEYGGGSWTVVDGSVYFSNFSDGRLYRQQRSDTEPPSAMCNSLDGSQSRDITSTAAIFAHATRSFPIGRSRSHRSSRPVPRHNVSARYTSPNWRERSTRTPFRRTGTVRCSLPSSNSGACSGVPISRRASPPRLNTSVLIELAKMRHRLLDDAPPDTHAAHQAPIAVDFPVLLANRVAQVHAPSEPAPQAKENT